MQQAAIVKVANECLSAGLRAVTSLSQPLCVAAGEKSSLVSHLLVAFLGRGPEAFSISLHCVVQARLSDAENFAETAQT